jgi:methyl-accepting chemotaxis protein
MKAVVDRLSRFGIGPRLLGTMVLLIIVAISASTFLAIRTAERALFAQGQAQLDANMRVGWEILTAKGAPHIDDGRLKFGTYVANGDAEIVDKVKALVGGTATIFMGDTRVATNVMKPDGTRAVGTKLAPGPARDAVFEQHRPYRGEAVIVGTRSGIARARSLACSIRACRKHNFWPWSMTWPCRAPSAPWWWFCFRRA